MSGIVVGYNSSPEGAAAVRTGVAEARLRGVPVVVVYSDRTTRFGGQPEDRAAAASRIDELLAGTGVEHEVRNLTSGKDPVQDVLDAADEVGADLIVIGIRRRSPVGKLVLGSHSQAILLEATAPVLAVKA
jgi:nucleotide-binding universal stress UspA family protein